jgi:predicted membrane channel-forming protein YqfA (hemolysin III family)
MSHLTKPLYTALGALCVVAVLAPLLVQLVVTIVPLVVVGGLVFVVGRLTWFYTNRG